MKNQSHSLFNRLRYAFDKTLSKGPLVLGLWLALVSITFIGGCVLVTFLGRLNPSLNLLQIFWEMLLQALAPNPVDINAGPWPFLLAMLVITLGGIFMVSIFIGVTTNFIDERIQSLRRGRTQAIEANHTVILGWDEHIYTIIHELVISHENQAKSCVVVLGENDKVEMESAIRERIPNTGHTDVICRSGSSLDMVDLRIASLDTAKSIIVLSPPGEETDSHVIKTLLAITNNPQRKKEPYHIVTEIHDEANIEAARLVGKNEAVILLIDDIIAHITAQTCRQSGLSAVYTELLNFEGDEIYFQDEPLLAGKTFGEALLMYEDSCVIGLCPRGGKPKLNPPMDTRINPGDQIIAISEEDDTVVISKLTSVPVQPDAIYLRTPEPPKPECTLILGWNGQGSTISRELDAYVAAGSSVTVVSPHAEIEAEVDGLKHELTNQSIIFNPGDPTSRKLLNSLNVEQYQHVIVLAEDGKANPQSVDAHTLVTLLHLRDINEGSGHPFSIVTEMLDVRNRTLAKITQADDFIVSDELASLLMAQISENEELSLVFDDLFYPEGSEIYIRPISDYVRLSQPVNFYSVVAAARQIGQVAIGYRQSEAANDPARSYGVVINPDKSKEVIFQQNDRIIILAEY